MSYFSGVRFHLHTDDSDSDSSDSSEDTRYLLRGMDRPPAIDRRRPSRAVRPRLQPPPLPALQPSPTLPVLQQSLSPSPTHSPPEHASEHSTNAQTTASEYDSDDCADEPLERIVYQFPPPFHADFDVAARDPSPAKRADQLFGGSSDEDAFLIADPRFRIMDKRIDAYLAAHPNFDCGFSTSS